MTRARRLLARGESYGYDAGGRLVSIDALDGSRTVYGYDKTDRLIAETDFALVGVGA